MKISLLLIIIVAISSFVQPSLSDDENAWIAGKVIWQGHSLPMTRVQVFTDPQLKSLYSEGIVLESDGSYVLEIEDPGDYYLVAFVDKNNNKQFDAGDGIGMYGISDWADSKQKAKPITLTKGQKATDIDILITAFVNENETIVPISSESSDDITTGISGRLIWQNHNNFTSAVVFVYSDPTWNNRVAQANVSLKGNFTVKVPPGQYYLLAVIDQNNTNLLDSGDYFGVWGMTSFDMFPKPIKVEEGVLKNNRNIIIIGKINSAGKPVPIKEVLNEKTGTISQSKKNLTLSGKVVWLTHDVKDAIVQVYNDASMIKAIDQIRTDDKGNFKIQLAEGDYYITASIDTDKNGKYTQGDVIGIYGSKDASSISPAKLSLNSDKEIEIQITAQFDDSGQLKPILSQEKENDKSDEPKLEDDTLPSVTGISGRIVWEGKDILSAVIVFSKDQEFKEGTRVNLELEKDGFYTCSAPPGGYYIMALIDLDEDGQIDYEDGIGFYGTGYFGMGYWGDPQKVYIIEGRTTPYININITASIGKDGKLIQTRDGIRSYYGDPDTEIDKAEENTQEWWYWSRGISFTFKRVNETNKVKWEILDKYEFEPKETHSEGKKENDEGKIYFSHDRNIWSINTDGSGRNWIGYGDSISGTINGDIMVFMDSNREIALMSAENNLLLGLNLKNTGYQPAISNDGKKIAYTKEIDGKSKIYVRDLITGEENVLPSGNLDVYYPSWSNDDELIAYSAEQTSVENKESANRDIYYYDTIAGQSERITTSPYDEFDPVWSFGSEKILVYCKTEGEISQLWMVSFDENGRPYEKQLTKYGGSNPAWSPKGDKIVYVNNGQLHTINIDGSNESPIIINNEPIFGLDPFWIR